MLFEKSKDKSASMIREISVPQLEIDESDKETLVCVVLVNETEYRVQARKTPVPQGYRVVKEGTLSECVAFLDFVEPPTRPS